MHAKVQLPTSTDFSERKLPLIASLFISSAFSHFRVFLAMYSFVSSKFLSICCFALGEPEIGLRCFSNYSALRLNVNFKS